MRFWSSLVAALGVVLATTTRAEPDLKWDDSLEMNLRPRNITRLVYWMYVWRES